MVVNATGKMCKHYKGGIYIVMDDNATNADTGERMVVYQKLDGYHHTFTRTAEKFFGKVIVEGAEVPRFAFQ